MVSGIATLFFVTTCLCAYGWWGVNKEWDKALELNKDFIKLHRQLVQTIEKQKEELKLEIAVSDSLRKSVDNLTKEVRL